MNNLVPVAVLGGVAMAIFGISLTREKGRKQVTAEGQLTGLEVYGDPGVGIVLVKGTVQNTGQVASDYEVKNTIALRDGWSVEYNVAISEIAPGESAPFNLRTNPLNFGTNDVITVHAHLFSTTGSPLDQKTSTITAEGPTRPSGEKSVLKWWEEKPEGGWTRPRNRVERTPTSTIRISRQLTMGGSSVIGTSNTESPNRLFGRSELAS